MSQSLKAFVKTVLQDAALQAEIGAAGSREAMVQSAVKLGASRGHHFTAAEFSAQMDSLETGGDSSELSDALLGAVAGGRAPSRPTLTGPSYGSSTLCTFCSASNGGKTYNQ